MCFDLFCGSKTAIRMGHRHCAHKVHAFLAKVGEEGVVVRDNDGVASVVQHLRRQHPGVVLVAALDALVACRGQFLIYIISTKKILSYLFNFSDLEGKFLQKYIYNSNTHHNEQRVP
jgi:hypothetical protein